MRRETREPTLFRKPRPKRATRADGVGKLNAAQRSLAYLRKLGYRAEVCEKFISRVEGQGQQAKFAGGYRKDLFGFADIIAFRRPGRAPCGPEYVETLAVQCTSTKQIAPHLRKYRGHAETAAAIRAWLSVPSRGFVVLGWEPVSVANRSKPGRRVEWRVTERWVRSEDVPQSDGVASVVRGRSVAALDESEF